MRSEGVELEDGNRSLEVVGGALGPDDMGCGVCVHVCVYVCLDRCQMGRGHSGSELPGQDQLEGRDLVALRQRR